MNPQDCDHAARTPHGVEVQGKRWYWCATCGAPVLIRISDGEVIRVGKP